VLCTCAMTTGRISRQGKKIDLLRRLHDHLQLPQRKQRKPKTGSGIDPEASGGAEIGGDAGALEGAQRRKTLVAAICKVYVVSSAHPRGGLTCVWSAGGVNMCVTRPII
jgi:hypothetical protein